MKLMLIDGNSILNRAFYGVRALTNSQGLFTNGIYGFLSIYEKEMAAEAPDAVCVCFDLKAPTFRHHKYEGYKAQRKGMPEELAQRAAGAAGAAGRHAGVSALDGGLRGRRFDWHAGRRL